MRGPASEGTPHHHPVARGMCAEGVCTGSSKEFYHTALIKWYIHGMVGRVSMEQVYVTGALGEIDSVHILRSDMYGASTIVAAGARDSTVYVWRKRPSSSEARGSPNQRRMREFTMATLNGHKGWVWSLISERDYRPQLLCSGSWDRSIKVWDVSVGECAATIEYVTIATNT